jgi:hypothetical protein
MIDPWQGEVFTHGWLQPPSRLFAVGAIAFSFSLSVVVFPAAVNLLLRHRRPSRPASDSRGGEAAQH